MKLLLRSGAGVSLGLSALALVMFGFALADVYFLTSGAVAPGEHLPGDRSAPALAGAATTALAAAVAGFASLALHRVLRKKAASVDSGRTGIWSK